MSKVLCFGELLLRLPPANAGEWLRTNQMPVFVGGAELNVATALANWDIPVKYCTSLPDNIISKDIKAYLEQRNIDTSPIIYSGERIGLYYLKEGADMKSEENVFDRKYSSFSTLSTGIVDWDNILKDVSWFHFSAIAPAVSASAAALCKEALEAASKKRITISVDLNYRSLLWKYGKDPKEVMPDLAKYCNVIMGNVWSANTLLDIPIDTSIHKNHSQENYLLQATQTAKYIFERFPKCNWVANTFRFDGNENAIEYYATLNTKTGQTTSPVFKTTKVVDKVGSGDCFMAGLIYGISSNHQPKNIISFAAAAAFGKLQEKGDSTKNSIHQIEKIVKDHS
ncbi:2-dehydro-3-deoxygluconokinase [mine drainage metagenome]|uniref:2-dehydro-3-deoxygluconokinase n=1 Tax=mine drainage metagenome TaxID=410659 RepID=A0A1J5S7B5_9ZZZZ